MHSTSSLTPDQTEVEARKIAKELWGSHGPLFAINLDGRERDCVHDDGEILHIMEVTNERKVQKLKGDFEKTVPLVKKIRHFLASQHDQRFIKIWLVTRDDPTADQRGLLPQFIKLAKTRVEILSLDQLRSKLIRATEYLSCRDNHSFGSVRSPDDPAQFKVADSDYIPLNIRLGDSSQNISQIKDLFLQSASLTIILAGFGAGKSMSMKYVYRECATRYRSGLDSRFPIFLNLSEHFGQRDPAEALQRHARSIGFSDDVQLVRAWKAGMCVLFLDGFDEMATSPFTRGKMQFALRAGTLFT